MLGRLSLHLPILHRRDTIMAVLKTAVSTSITWQIFGIFLHTLGSIAVRAVKLRIRV